MHRLIKNPFVFAISIALISILINLGIASIAEGSIIKGMEVLEDNGILLVLVPVSIAIEMFLFRYHRNLVSQLKIKKSEKIGFSGAVTSTGSMIFCCLHHVSDLLPTFGFIVATSSFLSEYKLYFTIIGLLVNLIISLHILNKIYKDNKILDQNIYENPFIT